MIGVETVLLILFFAPFIAAKLAWGQGYKAAQRDASRARRDHRQVCSRGEDDQ